MSTCGLVSKSDVLRCDSPLQARRASVRRGGGSYRKAGPAHSPNMPCVSAAKPNNRRPPVRTSVVRRLRCPTSREDLHTRRPEFGSQRGNHVPRGSRLETAHPVFDTSSALAACLHSEGAHATTVVRQGVRASVNARECCVSICPIGPPASIN